MTEINRFSGKYRFLSNFWPAEVVLDGITYPTVEHAYQAAKTADKDAREAIRSAHSPAIAKRAGKTVQLREDWESVRIDVMRELLRQKFTRNSDLRSWLLDTGDAILIEGNTWGDRFWGVCNGEGENHLGRLLMELRSSL